MAYVTSEEFLRIVNRHCRGEISEQDIANLMETVKLFHETFPYADQQISYLEEEEQDVSKRKSNS